MSQPQQDVWKVVYPGDKFPEGAVRALSRGLGCDQGPCDECDCYVALWVRTDGEAVFGKTWNVEGKADAAFPWGGKVVHGRETEGWRVLTYVGPSSLHGFKYRWVRAKKADKDSLLYVGEYTPAVVCCPKTGKEALGKANYSRKMAWICENEKEVLHDDCFEDSCFLLVKQKCANCDDDH